MNVSPIDRSTAAAATAKTSATAPKGGLGDLNAIGQAIQKADRRIQQQRDVTSVQLSSLGKLQSAYADVKTAAQALSKTGQTTSDSDVGSAASNFVAAFNGAATASRSASAAPSPLADSTGVRRAGSELQRTANDNAADLNKIGINRQKDGTLAIDKEKFAAALQSSPESVRGTLSAIGQQADRTATQELGANGNLGNTASTLRDRASRLESRQVDQQAQTAAAQQTIDAQSARFAGLGGVGGIVAYQRALSS